MTAGRGRAWIDGAPVDVAGGTVLEAARALGRDVPTLCQVDGLAPEGGCRVCLVEIEGEARPQPACATPLRAGMHVRTATLSLTALRRDILALVAGQPGLRVQRGTPFAELLAQHGLELPGGGADAGARTAVDEGHPYLRFDRELCIVCRRCLRTCEDVQGQFVYGIEGRGAGVRLAIGRDDRFTDSPCTACGACVPQCPTGALFETEPFGGAPPDATRTRSICGYCGVGCAVEILAAGGAVHAIDGAADGPANRGHLCAKGRYAHGWHRSTERLVVPLLREGGRLRAASWDEAVRFAADRLAEIRARRGPEALGALCSSRSTHEAVYLLQKLFRSVLGTNNVDCCARVCHASTAQALSAVTGTGAASASYADIERARAFVLAGANPTEAHPVVGARIKAAVLAGAPLLVVDPRRIELVDYAALHLPLRPGTNVALFNGLAKVLLARGAVDRDYLAARCEGLDELAAFLERLSLRDVERACGIPAAGIEHAAGWMAAHAPPLFVHGLGLSELTQGVASVMALCNLGLLTGSIGRAGAGMLPLRGQNNVQGSADMGAMPNLLTGYQPLDDADVRRRAGALWGQLPPEQPGLTLPEMLDAAVRGELAALWIQGEDIAQSDPNTTHVREALRSLELLVVQEMFLTDTSEHAHLVLPAAGCLEQEGTFTNGERRIQHVRPAVAPPGEARPDWSAVRDVAAALGTRWPYRGPADVMDEIAALAPRLFGGVAYERLGAQGLQWPCPSREHPGTATVHADGFLRGKGRLVVVDFEPSPEHDVAGYPFTLVTGRVLQHYNVGTMTRRTPQLALAGRDVLEVHPDDARRHGLDDGDEVAVESRWGSTRVPVRVSSRVAPGTLFLSFHFPQTGANRLTGPQRDPLSHCPEYKVTAVRLVR